jgi:excinuclease ABC subunit B
MYADNVTDSMKRAIEETNRRREKQVAYNLERGVDPQPLRKRIADITDQILSEERDTAELIANAPKPSGKKDKEKARVATGTRTNIASLAYEEVLKVVVELDEQMKLAAGELNFELAARLRDEIAELKHELRQMQRAGHA